MKINYNFSAISSSLRNKSYNAMVLKAEQKLAPQYISLDLLSITDIPFYNFDLRINFYPESVKKLCKSIKRSDTFNIITSEYKYFILGALINKIDFLSKHPEKLEHKKAVWIMSESPSLQADVYAQYNLRQILVAVNAMTMNVHKVFITQVNSKFDKAGNLIDEKTLESLIIFNGVSAIRGNILKNNIALYY